MKKLLLFVNLSVAFTFLTTIDSFSQITINTAATPAQMVNNLVGPGITFSNPVLTGGANAGAIFTTGNVTNLGMTSGVVLTSGDARLIPQNNSGGEGAISGGPAIPELAVIANSNTFDGLTLEFDFIPYSNSLSVRYIFGSEEYLEWVGSNFNDAFAFYISGPGIVGQQNLAVVAGSAVTINNINTGSNAGSFINNTGSGNGLNTIEYDGFTVPLIATRAVIPCSTYHIRLVIADGGDPALDSGVFIEENGFFSSGAITDVAVQPAYGLGSAFEGCAGSQFLFTMPNASATPTTFNYTVGGTATSGADYVPIPSSITIPAGQTVGSIPVTVLEDGIAEGAETITLTVQISPCSTQTFTMTINDATPVNVTSTNATICMGSGPANISATATGGNGTITYTWNNGGGAGTPISVNPPGTTVYTVTATDQCGKSATANSTVTVTPLPTSTFTVTSPVCQGNPSAITYTGNAAAGATYNWNFGGGTAAPGGVVQGPHTATWLASGSYNVSLAVTQNGCTGTPTTHSVTVNPTPNSPLISSNSPVCAGATINLTSNTIAGATYAWTGPNGFTSAVEDPSIAASTGAMTGTYNLYVIVNGCTSATASTVVNVTPVPAAPIISSNTPICQGGTVNLTANTIVGATYVWSGPSGFTSGLEDPSLSPATVGMSGNYTSYVVVAGCTSAVATTPVVVNPTPVTPTIASNTPVCSGNAINLTSNTVAGVVYHWAGPNGFTSAAEDPTINSSTVAMGGTYSLYLTALGCTSATANTVVVVNPTPATPTISSNTPICTGNNINLTSNTIAGATYNWTGPNGFTSAAEDPTLLATTVANSGTYSLYMTALNCTSATVTTPVVVNATPVTPTVASNTPICSGNPINLTSNTIAGATYHWTGPNGFTSAVEDPTINNSTVAMGGTYNLYLTATGCTSATANANVVVNQTPAQPTIASNTPVCAGNPLNLTSNTVANATYVWTGPNGFTSGQEDPTIAAATVAASGTYTMHVVVTGCSSTDATLNAVVNPIPASPTIASNTPVCQDGTINLTANTIAGATYTWSGPNGFTSTVEDPTINNAVVAASGTYSAYVTVLGCTSATANTPVIVNPTPAAPQISSNTPVCAGFNLNLTSNTINGATYYWSGPNSFTSSAEDPTITAVTLAASGNYSAYVTVLGCTSAISNHAVVINPIPASPVISSNTPICQGGAINFTANTIAGASYVWSGPNAFSSTLEDPSIASGTTLNAGSYSAYVVVLGCTSATVTTPVVVNLIPAALNIASNSPVCESGSINLTSNTVNGATYYWSGPNGFASSVEDPTLSPAAVNMSGTYSAYITVLGCTSAVANTQVVVNATPSTPVIAANSPVCFSETLNITSNTLASGTYTWSGPNGFTSSAEDTSWVVDDMGMAGDYSLYFTVLGCTSATSTVNVVVNPMPTADFAVTPQICLGNDAFALYNGTGPANATYVWNANGGNISGSGQGPINITWTTPGIQNLTLTVTQNGCTSVAVTHPVNIIAPVPADAGPDQTVCSGDVVNIGSQNLSGATFTWLTPNGIVDPAAASTTGSWTNTANNTNTVTITMQSDNQGCLDTDDAVITIVPIPVASINAPAAQCFSDNAFNFTAGGTFMNNATFAWTFQNANLATSVSQNPTGINFTAAGINDVTLTITQMGCQSAPFTVPVTVHAGPQAAFDQQIVEGCIPMVVNFTDMSTSTAGGIVYTWDFGHGTGSSLASPSHTYTQAGIYSVTLSITDNTGCSSSVTKPNLVKVYDNPVAGFYVNPDIIYIDQPYANVNDASTGNVTTWDYQVLGINNNFTTPNFMATFTDTGYYSITQTVTNAFGCSDIFTLEVHVRPVTEIFIPNAFTPGGFDNLNNTFKPHGNNLDEYRMFIFNRWGEMLFSTADINVGWDGTVRNSSVDAKQDLYVYKIQYNDHHGNAKELRGNVMVLR
jgi:gliding motility-associated-like protein